MHTGHCLNECGAMGHNLYVYCLGFRTTAALFDPRTSICWLRAIDPFEGPLKLLLSKKPVYSCFVDSNCLILLTQKLFPLTSPLYVWKKKSDNLDNSFSSYFNIVINHSRRQKHMIYWTNKNKAISQQFDTAQKTDELLIIWYLVRPF